MSSDPDLFRKFQLTNLSGNNNKFYEIRYWEKDSLARTSQITLRYIIAFR